MTMRFINLNLLALLLPALLLPTALATNVVGTAFLAGNGIAPGVTTTSSGLQYDRDCDDCSRGHGTRHPKVTDACEVYYEGRSVANWQSSGPMFDGGTATFAPNQVIAGWTEALQLMVEGDRWRVFIPSELAYGARGSPPVIQPEECLIFTIELKRIVTRQRALEEEPCAADPTKSVGESWLCDDKCHTCTCEADGSVSAKDNTCEPLGGGATDEESAKYEAEAAFESTVVHLALAFALVFFVCFGAVCFFMCVKGGNANASQIVHELEEADQ